MLAPAAHPSNRAHRFFDSRGPDGAVTPRPDASPGGAHSVSHGGKVLTFRRDQHKRFSHHGYVYSMLLVRGLVESAPSEEVLLTGSGDGSVKLWRLGQGSDGAPVQFAKLQNGSDAVLSIAVEGSFLYCGLAGGILNIWNLDSHQLVKRIAKQSGDLWAVDIIKGVTISGDSNGIVKVLQSSLKAPHTVILNSPRNSTPNSKRSGAGWHTKGRCSLPLPVSLKTGVFTPLVEMTTLWLSGT